MLLASGAVQGCFGDGFNWNGNWSGNRNYKVKVGENPAIAYTMGKVDLVIRSGRYEITEEGIPRAGTVSREETALNLTADSVMNHKQTVKMDGVVRRIDQNTIEYRGTGIDLSPVQLKRAPQPAK